MTITDVSGNRSRVLDAKLGDQALVQVVHERLSRCNVDRGKGAALKAHVSLVERCDSSLRFSRRCGRREQHVPTTYDLWHHRRLTGIRLPPSEEDRKGVRHNACKVGSSITHPRASTPPK